MATNEQKYWLHSTLGVHGLAPGTQSRAGPASPPPPPRSEDGGSGPTMRASSRREPEAAPVVGRGSGAVPVVGRDTPLESLPPEMADQVRRVMDPNRNIVAEALGQMDAEDAYDRRHGTITAPPRDTTQEFRTLRDGGVTASATYGIQTTWRGRTHEQGMVSAGQAASITDLAGVAGPGGSESSRALEGMPPRRVMREAWRGANEREMPRSPSNSGRARPGSNQPTPAESTLVEPHTRANDSRTTPGSNETRTAPTSTPLPHPRTPTHEGSNAGATPPGPPEAGDPGADTGLNRRLIPAHELVTVRGGRADSPGRPTPRQRREVDRIGNALGGEGPFDAAHLNARSQSERGPFRVRPQDPAVNRAEADDIARSNAARRRWNAEHPEGPHLTVREPEPAATIRPRRTRGREPGPER
jgi:hypothetical protein